MEKAKNALTFFAWIRLESVIIHGFTNLKSIQKYGFKIKK